MIPMWSRINCLILVATCLPTLLLASHAAAIELVANFDGGTAAVPDAFTGTAGDGWEASWNSAAASPANSDVANTVPNSGGPNVLGGNYLRTTVTTNTLGYSGAATYSLNRKFGSGIDQTNPYRVEFTYRIDEDVESAASSFTGFQDRYMIAEGQGGMTTLNNLSNAGAANNNYSWSIWGHGGDIDLQSPNGSQIASNVVRTWAFYDGNSNNDEFDANSAAMTSTGIPIVTGGIYDFTIDVDPSTQTWAATVEQKNASGAILAAFTQSDMGYRNDDGVKSTLHFFTKRSRLDSFSDPDTRAFSIDGVTITQETAATLFVDRHTGAIRLSNSGTVDLQFLGYSITSQLGALNASASNFKSISNNYDQGNAGAIDPDDDWTILSEQVNGTSDLSEFQFSVSPADGAILGPGQDVLLSQGDGAWIPSFIEDDLFAELTLDDENGTVLTIPVVYEDSAANLPLMRSDLNHDGAIDSLDWDIFTANNLTVFTASNLSAAQMYQLGDIDFDGDNDANDYLLFRSDYIAVHGAASFAALLSSSQHVPEPSSLALIALFGLFILSKNCWQAGWEIVTSRSCKHACTQLCGILILLGVACIGTRAHAQVIANFDGGTAAVPDAFVGIPGDGWASDWTSFTASASNTAVNEILGTDGPIPGGGNYLHTTVTSNTSGYSGAATYSLNRNFTEGIDQSSPYTIQFTYRIDEDINSGSSTFTGFEDRYMIAEGATGMTTLNNTNPGNANNNFSWSVWGFGGDTVLPGGTETETNIVKTWAFYDGDGSGSTSIDANSSAMISTGIPMVTGRSYEFTIDVNPVASTWQGSIDDGVNPVYESPVMGSHNSSGIGSRLNFFTKRSRLDAGTNPDVREFSIDGISIENTPTAFVALINTVTGDITLRNDTGADIEFSNYTINSPLGALDTGGWYSLDERSADGDPLVLPVDSDDPGSIAGDSSVESWTESGGSDASTLGELFLIGSTTLPAGQSISLGNAYNTSMSDLDITFQFYDVLGEALLPGAVEFVSTPVLAGDYNGDGSVDAADYTVWRNNLGASISLPNETETLGSVTFEDYTAWKNNFGASNSALLAHNFTVPESSSLYLLLLALAGYQLRSVIRI